MLTSTSTKPYYITVVPFAKVVNVDHLADQIADVNRHLITLDEIFAYL